MKYEELKKEISIETDLKMQISRKISVLKDRIEKFSNVEKYIAENKIHSWVE